MHFIKLLFSVLLSLLVFSCEQSSDENNNNNKVYASSSIPENMTLDEKKLRYETLMVPPVQKVHCELMDQYKKTAYWLKKGSYPRRIAALKEEYKAETDEQLLAALKPHPPSIALGQGALESAWGTSRFFVEANNVFGIWSFDPQEDRLAADSHRSGQAIWLKKYDSLEDSVRDYYQVLAKGHAHQHFRDLRLETDNPYQLIRALDQYSESREAYVESLFVMISYNQLTRFDITDSSADCL